MFNNLSVTKILKRLDRLPKANIEEALKTLEKDQTALCDTLNNLSVGVLILEGSRPLFINRYALNFLEISESADFSKSLSELARPKEVSDWISKKIQDSDQGFRSELHFVNSRALIVSLESGRKSKLPRLLSFVDITDKLEEVEQVFRNNRVEYISELARAVAHEIKNPLHSLSLHVNILKSEIASSKNLDENRREKINKSLGVLLDETSRLDQLTNHFLKLGSLKDSYRCETDLNQLIKSVLATLEPELAAHLIELVASYDERLPKLMLQKNKIHQVFINLLKNSIEATEKGRILIKTSRLEHLAKIEIRDTGVGIPEKNLDKIFEAYFSTKKKGSGLGLVMVKETIEEHGGSVRVTSQEGKGTTFTIYLPVKPAPLRLPKGGS